MRATVMKSVVRRIVLVLIGCVVLFAVIRVVIAP